MCAELNLLSRFDRLIYNKTLGMFASLLILVQRAVHCAPTNKMDVD